MDTDDEHALAAEDERIRRGMWRQRESLVRFKCLAGLVRSGPTKQMLTRSFYLHGLRDADTTFGPAAEKPAVFIKPFEEEEFAARRTRLVMAHHADRMGLPVDHHFDMGGMWRIRRLHASVLGFYKVITSRC